jgi:hypothetical protein
MTAARFLSLRPAVVAVGLTVAFSAFPAHAQERRSLAPTSRRVTGAHMARAGLTRVSGLFRLLEGWETASLDGYAARPSAVGMPGAPLLAVGGQPFAPDPFGGSALSMLPVHRRQVRAAAVSRAPQLVNGRLAPDGAARVSLPPPDEPGFGAQGAFSAGNEVGDPGPFRNTERSVLNVDRIGPQYFAETSLRGPRGASAQMSVRALRHYTTDRAIRARTAGTGDSLDGPPLQQFVAPRLVLQAGRRLPGAHRLTAHYAALRALPFFETLGYEVPARRRRARATAQGRLSLLPGRRSPHTRYRLGYRRSTLRSDAGRLSSSEALPLDWTADDLSGHVSLGGPPLDRLPLPDHLPLDSMRLRVGASSDYTRVQAEHAFLDDPDVLTTRAYATLSAPAALRPRLSLLLSQTDEQWGGGALFSSRVALGNPFSRNVPSDASPPRYTLGLRLGYVRRPYAADGSRWYWLGQGLPVPRASDGRVLLPASFSPSDRLTTDLRLRRAVPGGPRLTLELGARHFRGLTLPDADYGFAPVVSPNNPPPGGRLIPNLRLRTDASGQTFYATAQATHSFPGPLTHRVRYDFFTHRAGGSGSRRRAFAQRFQRVPRHRGRYTARLSVDDRFSLEGRVTARSPERWPAYRRAAASDRNIYRSRLPARLRVDLTATKRLWRDYLRVRLALRNLLDAPLRSHPASPVQRLALFVSVEAQL